MMNSVFKLCRYTLSNKNIFQRLYQPICAVESVQLSKTKLCNNFKESTSQNKVPKSGILLCVSLLTWLGFTKDDEEKESELIMTIKRAILCTQREEWTKAEQMLHLALRLAQEQQNQQGILYVYDIMANLALERGEADKAEMLFVNVLQRLLSQGMKQEDIKVIHISLKLARICHMKGDIEKAEIGFQWCLDTLKKHHLQSNNQDAVALYGVIQDWYAQLLLDKGKVNEALKHLKDAHRICSQVEGESSEKSVLLLNDLGTASWKVGDLNSAQEYFNQAIRMGKNMEEFNYLGAIYANLGLVYLQKGVPEQAKKHCKEGWRLGKKQKNNDVMEQANYCFEQIKSHV